MLTGNGVMRKKEHEEIRSGTDFQLIVCKSAMT